MLVPHLSHPYMTTGKTIALIRWTFVGKVMSLLLNMLSRLVIISFLSDFGIRERLAFYNEFRIIPSIFWNILRRTDVNASINICLFGVFIDSISCLVCNSFLLRWNVTLLIRALSFNMDIYSYTFLSECCFCCIL